jgi:hypothetical protein
VITAVITLLSNVFITNNTCTQSSTINTEQQLFLRCVRTNKWTLTGIFMHYNLSEIPDSNIQETETQHCIRSRSDV